MQLLLDFFMQNNTTAVSWNQYLMFGFYGDNYSVIWTKHSKFYKEIDYKHPY